MTHIAPAQERIAHTARMWQSLPLKYVLRNVVEKDTDEPLPFVALEHIEGGTGRLVDGFEWVEIAPGDYAKFPTGDILFGKLRPYLRKYLSVDRAGCCPTELLVLRPLPVLDAHYGFYVMQSDPVINYANASSYGVKMPRTSWTVLGRLRVSVPPLPEQSAIADFLNLETARIDELVAKLGGRGVGSSTQKNLAALLTEKRSVLITAAVTGQIDVSRHAA